MIRYFSFYAITKSVLFNVVASLAMAYIITLFWVFVWGAQGASNTQIQAKLSDPDGMIWVGISALFAGALIDLFAAYLAASEARYLEYWHAAIAFGITVFLFMALFPSGSDGWVRVISLLSGLAATGWGAYMSKKHKQQRSSDS